MSGRKHIDRIAVIATALMLVLTILFMNGTSLGIENMAHTMGYENRLFDNTKVHTIDIVMNDWEDFISNATNEEYYTANVVIDGESYKNVGIRAKGNTSLSTVSSLGSERYSFKIEFDHYDSTKSYHGLDKLSLNNLIQDSTMMKDYLTYTMMKEFGVSSTLCSYVYITVNGEDWGLYLAVEGVEEAFLERNYGSDYGELYKPDSMSFGGGRGNGVDFDMGDFDFNFGGTDTDTDPDTGESGESSGGFNPSSMFGGGMPNMPPSRGGGAPDGASPSDIPKDFEPSAMFGGNDDENDGFSFGGGFGMGSSDVKLQYIDDELDSYSNIWNNAKTDITENDQNRLIESLKKLSGNEDIASVVDVEQVIRYFVVHNYVCNDDSYTGMMVHNYYLYEKDGQLAMIPWDYNLGFGTFGGGDATGTVNTPIDTPVSDGSSDRPMLNWIFESEKYTALYHQYFAEFLSSVDIQGIIDNAYNLIKSYVEKDPTAFFTYDEFELGVETLRQFCDLRSESISMQLDNGKTTNDMSYVDASAITLSDMGSMGGGMGGFSGDMPNMPDNTADFDSVNPGSNQSDDSAAGTAAPSDSQDGQTNSASLPEDVTGNMPSDMPSDMPEGFDTSNLPSDFNGSFPGQSSDDSAGNASTDDGSGTTGDTNMRRPSNRNMQMPNGDFRFDMNGTGSSQSNLTSWI